MSAPFDVDKVDQIVRSTAKRIVWDFPGIDHEDIAQELWMKILEVDFDPDDESFKPALYRLAKTMAWEIRRDQLQASAQYSYRTEDVKIILETCFDGEDWSGVYVPRDAANERDAMAGLEVKADAVIAYRQLAPEHKEQLSARYNVGIFPEDPRKLNRAIKALADQMNSYYGMRGETE